MWKERGKRPKGECHTHTRERESSMVRRGELLFLEMCVMMTKQERTHPKKNEWGEATHCQNVPQTGDERDQQINREAVRLLILFLSFLYIFVRWTYVQK
jgi:hypothetical protein